METLIYISYIKITSDYFHTLTQTHTHTHIYLSIYIYIYIYIYICMYFMHSFLLFLSHNNIYSLLQSFYLHIHLIFIPTSSNKPPLHCCSLFYYYSSFRWFHAHWIFSPFYKRHESTSSCALAIRYLDKMNCHSYVPLVNEEEGR